jgi:pullulanase/glycogen debranching enzyme
MVRSIFDPEITDTFKNVQQAATHGSSKTVLVDGENITIPYPFPSPEDWRDGWIYFLMIDRFNHHLNPPKSKWNGIYDFRQGGNFKGIQQQLPYIASLGATAIWISPVLKNSKPDWPFNYHGYAPQDFLNLDGRFASDGTPETAERELTALIDEAHARGMYVILDIVINHAAAFLIMNTTV